MINTNELKSLITPCLCILIIIVIALTISAFKQVDSIKENPITSQPSIFHCEASATCYSSNNTNTADLIQTINTANPEARYDYIIISTKNPIESIAVKTQEKIAETCLEQELCFSRKGVLKATMIQDLSKLNETNKSVFFKYIPAKNQ